MDADAPKRISDRILRLDIDGYLMPVDDVGQPVLLAMPGTDDQFIPVFSSKAKLDAVFSAYGIDYVRIKRIDHGPTFLASLTENVLSFRLRVAVDAYKHENGRLRFTEIPL